MIVYISVVLWCIILLSTGLCSTSWAGCEKWPTFHFLCVVSCTCKLMPPQPTHWSYFCPHSPFSPPALSPSLSLITQAKTCVCHVCHSFTPRLHTCLMCVYFGCMNPDSHMRVHVKSAGHPLGNGVIIMYMYIQGILCISHYELERESLERNALSFTSC